MRAGDRNGAARIASTAAAPAGLQRCPGGVHRLDIGSARVQRPRVLQIVQHPQLLYKWATWSHANKPKSWIVGRYFGKFNKFRNDRWVFGRDSDTHLVKFSWTDIVRHVMVKGTASPDDPALADYWAQRREKVKPPLDRYTLRLLTRQDARCPLCGDHLLTAEQSSQPPEQWEQWWLQVTRKAIAASYLVHHGRPGSPDGDQTRLIHASCHRGHLARQRREPALLPAAPERLA